MPRPFAVPRRRPRSRRGRALLALLLLLASFLLFLIPAVRYFRALTGAMAVSNATDLITRTVSDIVEEKMLEMGVEGTSFVSFEKDDCGAVTAIITGAEAIDGAMQLLADWQASVQ